MGPHPQLAVEFGDESINPVDLLALDFQTQEAANFSIGVISS
jgi:hypothetical protein